MNSTTRFISDILFDKEIDLVLFPAKNNDKFWDSFVRIASSHYVIPALYYKLKERDYIKLLNDELASYLEEIYSQNLERNLELLKEVNEISNILKSNNIDHVFLKGSALISSLYKDSIGIRMVGDIDIFISNDQVFESQELMFKNGYKKLAKYDGLKGRHLPRLINHNKVFAVELHDSLANKDSSLSKHNTLLKRKIIKKVNILEWSDLLYHCIINFQKNDHGSLRAAYSFRTLLDFYEITKFNPESINKLEKSIHVDKFKLIMNKFQGLKYKYETGLIFFNLRLKLKFYSSLYSYFDNIFFNIIVSFVLNLNRLIEFVKIKEYRYHVLNKLGFIK
mgnify:CR=1 FL=1